MISKSSYSGLKYSPYASPFLIKNLGITHSMSQQPAKETDGQSKMLNNSLFSLSLLSPAPEKEMAMPHFKENNNRGDMEICGRRLFQSPAGQFKGQSQNMGMGMGMSSKGGQRSYQNKLEEILEEDTNNNNIYHNTLIDAHHNYDNTNDHLYFSNVRPSHNLDIMIHDDDMKGLSNFGHRSSHFHPPH